jgi:hypothetical protein
MTFTPLDMVLAFCVGGILGGMFASMIACFMMEGDKAEKHKIHTRQKDLDEHAAELLDWVSKKGGKNG